MIAALPIPPADPLGYPVPVDVLRALSYLTLTLHLLAMNFTLGGVLLLLWVKLRKPAHHEAMQSYLGYSLPLGFSYLVTLGIPPLLFVQVIYGQMFYSSSVVIGFHWILVVPLLILAYGLFYWHKLTRVSRPRRQWLVLAVALAAMLAIGFFYVNNLTLAQTPQRWLPLYQNNPGGGTLNAGEPTLFPRWILFIVPALAVSGLGLLTTGTILGRRRHDAAPAFRSLGLRAFVLGMVLLTGAAAWTVARLPADIAADLWSGGTQTLLLATGAALALLAGGAALLAARSGRLSAAIAGGLLAALALAALVILRDQVRIAYLAPYFDARTVPVHSQWGMFALFVAVLLAGLALLAFLITRVALNLARAHTTEYDG